MRYIAITLRTGLAWFLSAWMGLFLVNFGHALTLVVRDRGFTVDAFANNHVDPVLLSAAANLAGSFLFVLPATAIAAPTITICNALLKGRTQVAIRVMLGAAAAVAGTVLLFGKAYASMLLLAIPLGGAAAVAATGEPALRPGRFWLATLIGDVLGLVLWNIGFSQLR